MKLILRWIINALAIIIVAYLINGVNIEGFYTALWLSLFLGFINAIIKPILLIVTLPINILTLGLFTFVINAAIILLANSVIKGFHVDGFWTALIFSVVLSIVSYILNKLFGTKK
jgi:putative membrane protein